MRLGISTTTVASLPDLIAAWTACRVTPLILAASLIVTGFIVGAAYTLKIILSRGNYLLDRWKLLEYSALTMTNNNTTIKTRAPRRYYFHEKYYHHLMDQKRDREEMSQYGVVGYNDKWGWYWEVTRTRKEVSAALDKLGYVLSR